MEANDFIVRLKADNIEKDNRDLQKVFDEYKTILSKLPAKDRGPWSLNVLRTLCWNIDKAPIWRDAVDNQVLLSLSIDCVRETRVLDKSDRVKTLACIYHLHRHVVRLNKSIQPELVLKISFMPFELDSKHLLQEYNKTYWNILADRITYFEKLKAKVNIAKLLPKLTEDIAKVIEIYDTVQFVSTILVFLIKKLHFLYNEKHAKELSQTFGKIFAELSKKDDLKQFKNLTENENLEVYMKLNDCVFVVTENASKVHFKDCMLDNIVRTCISLVGHSPDLFHCLQTFYQNSFCCILSVKTNLSYTETVLGSLQNSLETTEKLGYKKAIDATYPYLSQLLRLYIEYNVTNCSTRHWKDHFDIKIQENCLNLMLFFMKKLKYCAQLLKCDNCRVNSGLHDSLRLSLLIKHFVTISLSQKILITSILDIYHTVIIEQYKVLSQLEKIGCVNHQKFFRKLQTDVHNTAITLNKAQYFEVSIKLFDIYLEHELKCYEVDSKNISRAFFNKSICELDCLLYENALIDAFLSLTCSNQEGLKTDKYMSLVMDIKAKELKSKAESDEEDLQTETLQLLSIVNACKMALERKLYGDLKLFMSELKFSELLKHEFSMYAKLWPSIAPIGGVWRSLLDLSRGNFEEWMTVEEEDVLLQVLYEIILETPSVVRTVHSEYFSTVIKELLEKFNNTNVLSTDMRVVHATLLFLQFEYDLAAASQKYGWKPKDTLQSMDPDQIVANRTIPQEFAATHSAIKAVELLRDILPAIGQASKTYLRPALQVYQVFVPLLLHLCRDVQGLTLAYICCQIAEIVNDDECYLTNCGTLLSSSASAALPAMTSRAAEKCAALGNEPALLFLCDAAVHYHAVGDIGTSSRLVQIAQAAILRAMTLQPELNLDLAVGRLLEAQALLCQNGDTTSLTAVNAAQRHYLAVSTTGIKWSARRHRSLSIRLRTSVSTSLACRLAHSLCVRARARAAAAVSLAHETAPARAQLYGDIVDVASFDDAQIKIDNRMKHALGLQPSNEIQPYYAPRTKPPHFTPKQEIETMLDNMVLKKGQISPSLPCVSVPAFKVPDFFNHDTKCECYACEIPTTLVLACRTSGLEAAMYAKANENEIARNYFAGALGMMAITERKLAQISHKFKETYDKFIVDSAMRRYESEFKRSSVEILIEITLFELMNKNYDIADEYIVRIHEVMQEGAVDKYLTSEVANLMVASAKLKSIVKRREMDLDDDSLKLSPLKYTEPPKTPINKASKPPQQATKIVVKNEELPKKLKVIKLNLDDEENDFEKPKRSIRNVKKDAFKVPNPITARPALELATPKPARSVPTILRPLYESDNMATPTLNKTKTEFFTPCASTPEQFFTPFTSVKTYKNKSLRHNIVKNLENVFASPKVTPSVEIKTRIDSVKVSNLPVKVQKLVAKEEKLVVEEEKVEKETFVAKDKSVVQKDTRNIPQRSYARKDSKKNLIRAVSPVKQEKICVDKKQNNSTDTKENICTEKKEKKCLDKKQKNSTDTKENIITEKKEKLCMDKREKVSIDKKESTIKTRRLRKQVNFCAEDNESNVL